MRELFNNIEENNYVHINSIRIMIDKAKELGISELKNNRHVKNFQFNNSIMSVFAKEEFFTRRSLKRM